MNYDEIETKLVQALLVWKQQGGPRGITISDATAITAKKNPGVSASEMKSIIESSILLELEGNNIVLSSELTNLM